MLRVVGEEPDPLSREEMQEYGNELVSESRQRAIEAMRASMISQFLAPKRSVGGLSLADIRQWRWAARRALEAWQKVDALTSELIIAVDRAERARKAATVESGDTNGAEGGQ